MTARHANLGIIQFFRSFFLLPIRFQPRWEDCESVETEDRETVGT